MRKREEYQKPIIDIFFIRIQDVLTGSALINGDIQDGSEDGEDFEDMGW